MFPLDIKRSPRHAASVKRYHTWPTIQTQTNADHSFGVLRIWIDIFGTPDPHITYHIVTHDLGEIVSGDAPFPVKMLNPKFKEEHDKIEEQALVDLGYPPVSLNEQEKVYFKICDLLEMMEFGMSEMELGNVHGGTVVIRTREAAMKQISNILDPLAAVTVQLYINNRVKEHLTALKSSNLRLNYNDGVSGDFHI